MPKFKRCDKSVPAMAAELLTCYENYKPILDAKVAIDYVFAYSTTDAPALKLHGERALAIARVIKLKDRAMGRGDCEVCIDGDWWRDPGIKDEERRAVLDHELYHFVVILDDTGFKRDTFGRPCIGTRRHDRSFGWFDVIAQRHGEFSMERKQAHHILSGAGQMYWPELIDPKTRVATEGL